jgi:hypothetical protein
MVINELAVSQQSLNRRSMLHEVVQGVVKIAMAAAAVIRSRKKITSGWQGKARRREWVSMRQIYEQLGDNYFRRVYRMDYCTFCQLSNMLQAQIVSLARKPGSNPEIVRSGPNGRIQPSVRLGIALRFFAGGSNYDIMTTFGVGQADVSKSIWIVVEAVNRTNQLAIEFPRCHEKQHEIARQFQVKSTAGFDCCAGAVDGILIWIQQPSEADSIVSRVGIRKLFCSRKNKFGLNCQAICDAQGKFLDISMMYPGATSDVLAFESSTIYSDLADGVLAPGLCLFGDNAYINSWFMATPFSGFSGGTKDAYNFYHS